MQKSKNRLEKATDFHIGIIPAYSDLPWGGRSNADYHIRVEQRKDDKGNIRWAVIGNMNMSRQFGICLGVGGRWELEQRPSNCSDDFLDNFRFDDLDNAFEAAESVIQTFKEIL